jgi:hypothetical protein
MNYHSDRFNDYSLLIFKEEKLIAVFPANLFNDELYSHQGLTYGGLILQKTVLVNEVFLIFESLCEYLKSQKVKNLYVKQIPEIYYKTPAFELEYALSKKAVLEKKEMVLAIDYSKSLSIHKTKLKHFRKSDKYSFEIKENTDFESFWNQVLEPRLLLKHKAKPVHSLAEIKYLQTVFPNNIKQFNVFLDNEILAGITIFENENVVKSQYGATTEKGEKCRALDYLFLHLIYKYKEEGKHFFSMGTITKNNEKGFNTGLLKQKQELGCQMYLEDFYKLNLS